VTKVSVEQCVFAIVLAILAGGLTAASCDAHRTARAAIGRCR
jgi:hypothetical protein